MQSKVQENCVIHAMIYNGISVIGGYDTVTLESLVANGHKKECNLRLLITLFCLPAGSLGWSWRDSNSRPNEELICFLHVYLRLHCRGRARPKPPTHPLSSKVSPETRGLSQTISDIAAPPDRNASEPQHPGDVTSPQLLQGLSLNLLYFD